MEEVNKALLRGRKPIKILAVEDDPLAMAFLEAQIQDLGHDIVKAENGKESIEVLVKNKGEIDVVLMDRMMPVMDGLTAVRSIKEMADLRDIPIIMVTGADKIEEMQEGLDAGVFYYLTKPVGPEMLRSVLSAAVREAQQNKTLSSELGKHRTSFGLIDTCKFKFKTLEEAESLSAFMANCFPDPVRVLSGLGELLINAVEHGNLGIGYDRKTELVKAGIWRAEIIRLQSLPEHYNKHVIATVAHKDDGIYGVIEDEGRGFEWQKYLHIDPARSGDNHGRGIAQANATSFDRLTYNDAGNKAMFFVSYDKTIEW